MNKNIILKILTLISIVAVMIAIPVMSVAASTLTYENDEKKVIVDEKTMTTGTNVSFVSKYSLEYSPQKINDSFLYPITKDSFAVIRIGLGGVDLSNKQVRWRIQGSDSGRIQFGFMNANGNTVFVKKEGTDGGNLNKFNIYKSSNGDKFSTDNAYGAIDDSGIKYNKDFGECYYETKTAVAAGASGQFKGYSGNGYVCTGIDFSNIDTALIEFPTTLNVSFNIFSIEAREVGSNGAWEKIFDAENCTEVTKQATTNGANTDGYYKKGDYSFGTRPTFDDFSLKYSKLTKTTKNTSLANKVGDVWTKAEVKSETISLDETNALVMDLNTIGCSTFDVHFVFRHIMVNNAQVDYKAFGKGYYVDENGKKEQVDKANFIKPNFKGRLLIPFSSFKEDGGSTLDTVTGKSATHLFFVWKPVSTDVHFDMKNFRFVDVDINELQKMVKYNVNIVSNSQKGEVKIAGDVASSTNLVNEGSNVELTIAPKTGYVVDNVKLNGVNLGPKTSLNLLNVEEDKNVEVTYSDKTSIDVYILAGQSNAAGFTPVSGLYKPYTYGGQLNNDKIIEYQNGYKDVMYYGIVETNSPGTTGVEWTVVSSGKGKDKNKIGPELGFAEAMSSCYGGDNGKSAIIKYAVGGTGFTNASVSVTNTYGNWMSPSLIKEKKGQGVQLIDKAGLMYDNLVKTFKLGLSQLIAQGYNPVIKGAMWLQGCQDACVETDAPQYANYISLLIEDLRKDVGTILNEKEINQDVSEMPFVICKIAEDLERANYEDVVRKQMQIASKQNTNVRIVETIGFILPDINDNNDVWHFSAKDMLEIGRRFAGVLNQMNGKVDEVKMNVTFDTDGGSQIDGQQVLQYMSAEKPANPTKKGFIFSHWVKDGDSQEFDFDATAICSDITIKAVWNKGTGNCEDGSDTSDHVYDNGCDMTCNVCGEIRTVSGHVYTDDDDADCNECGHTRKIVKVTNGTKVENADGSITVTANAAPEGMEFKGWQDADGNIVSTDISYTVNSNVNLKAVYDKVTVTPVDPNPTDTSKKKGLSGGAIAGIAASGVAVVGICGFAIFWFGVKKKSFAELLTAIKSIFKKK